MRGKHSFAVSSLMLVSLFALTTAVADTKGEIDTNVTQALTKFYAQNPKHQELADKAVGILVFPRVTKGGVGVGGEYGEGALQVKGATVDYYKMTSGSVGATLGMASRSEILMFMTQESLDKFTKSKGWKAGVDAGVAVMSMGAGGQYDTKTMQQPIIGFVFGEKGLIGDLSFEGSKITKI